MVNENKETTSERSKTSRRRLDYLLGIFILLQMTLVILLIYKENEHSKTIDQLRYELRRSNSTGEEYRNRYQIDHLSLVTCSKEKEDYKYSLEDLTKLYGQLDASSADIIEWTNQYALSEVAYWEGKTRYTYWNETHKEFNKQFEEVLQQNKK
jgi:hypothetical protein